MGGPIIVMGCPFLGEDICAKYSRLLNITQKQLLTTVIDNFIPKLFAPTSAILKYFNGVTPPGSLNFLTNPRALNALKEGFVSFFGGVLKCNDPRFPTYLGADIGTVHAFMGISENEFDLFNSLFISILSAIGASSQDQTTALELLESTKPYIVGSFCTRQSTRLGVSQLEFIQKLVNALFSRVLSSNSVNLKYFNGQTPPGSTNFLDPTNAGELEALLHRFVTFFGTIFLCNDPMFPVYTGQPLTTVHAPMGISQSELDDFNSKLLSVLADFGVVQADISLVNDVLDGLRSYIVSPR